MTFFHVLNFAIPIASMIAIGFLLDRMCKPTVKQEESKDQKS
ncbi:hypothetical protein [Robertmurraya kyonggiensis]|nr:hypothetical protein [Robertmurraya kyonggiensis]